MEGVRIFTEAELAEGRTVDEKKKVEVTLVCFHSFFSQIIENDLKQILTGLAVSLFGNVEMKWKEDYFPFTQPSFELEVLYDGKWLEVLGCGVIHDQVESIFPSHTIYRS
jgi:phenylalanyl-tRNA synthetase alpha chain